MSLTTRLRSLARTLLRISCVPLITMLGVGLVSAGGRPEQPATADRPEPVTLMLDWVPNVNHTGLYVARDRGFFEAEGLDVRIVEPGEVYASAAVVGGLADFGIDFQESVTLLQADVVPIVSIAAILQTNTSGFATRAADRITSPAGFAGLTYGTFNSPYEEPTIDALVRCSGGDPSGIRYVTAGTDLLAMLSQGQADFVWIFYGTQGFQAKRIGLDLTYFPLNEYADCIPDYYSPLVVASERTVAERPDLTRRFIRALERAHAFVIDRPAEAASILARAVPELDAAELEQSVPWLAMHLVMDAPGWGYQRSEVWQRYADWLGSVGILTGRFDAESAFTNEFLSVR